MEGKFTYTDANDPEWAYELFDTHEEALQAGARIFKDGVLVGQLKSYGINFKIVNVYEYNEITNTN